MPDDSIDYFISILIIINDLFSRLIIFFLILLYSDNIICIMLNNGLGYIFLAPHRVNCNNTTT